jgi:hypothetical protein
MTRAWKPAVDSTTALQLQNAAGTSVLNVDTTNEGVTLGGVLIQDGEAVALDFAPGVAATAKVGMASDPTIVAFFDMTDQQLVGYVVANFGFTAQQAGAFVVLRDIIRGLARAAGVARR